MGIMELGAIGELVSGVAVVATLIYLSVQIRQARHEAGLEGIRARADTAMAVLRPFIEGDQGDWGLDDEETVRFGTWCHTWMQAQQARFFTLPAGTNESQETLHLWWLSTPWGAEFWDKNWGFYDEAFVVHMNELKERLESDSRTPAQIRAGRGR